MGFAFMCGKRCCRKSRFITNFESIRTDSRIFISDCDYLNDFRYFTFVATFLFPAGLRDNDNHGRII